MGTPLCIRHYCAGLTAHMHPGFVDKGQESGKVNHYKQSSVGPQCGSRLTRNHLPGFGAGTPEGMASLSSLLNIFKCGFHQQESSIQPGAPPPPLRVGEIGVSGSVQQEKQQTRFLWSPSLPGTTRKTGWGSCLDHWLLTPPQPLPLAQGKKRVL